MADDWRKLRNQGITPHTKADRSWIETALYTVCGAVIVGSTVFMGTVYFGSDRSGMHPITTAKASTEEAAEIVNRARPQIEAATRRMIDDVVVPNVNADSNSVVYEAQYNECRDAQLAKIREMGEIGAGMAFGGGINHQSLGGRSKSLGKMLTCLGGKRAARLCDQKYRSGYVELVKRYMDSNTPTSLGLKMVQANMKEMLAKKSPEERRKYMMDEQLGPYAPGYQHVEALFVAGYLQGSDFSFLFFAPEWVGPLAEKQGDRNTVC